MPYPFHKDPIPNMFDQWHADFADLTDSLGIKIFIILLLPVLLYPQTIPDSMVSVTFIVNCEDVASTDTIYLSGNNESFGNWHPGLVALDHADDNTWRQTFNLKKGTNLKYKFTRGCWEKEAIYINGQTPMNSELLVRTDTSITVKILSWRDKIGAIEVKGQITGDVKYHRNIEGYGLKSRDLIVWLPPGYNQDLSRYYPVLYMHDGQNLFDPGTSVFGIDWQMDETADSLISENLIKPLIIVGIYNTPDRSREYMESDTGSLYMKLVVNVIKPMVDEFYRTKSGREHTATAGSSAGGLISFMLLWVYPEVFSRAACISVPFKYSSDNSEINYVDNVRNDYRVKPDIRCYIDIGDDALDSPLRPGFQEMVQALKNKGYLENEDFIWYQLANSKHNESSWAKNSWRFLDFLFGSKK